MRDERGVTLVELLAAITLSSIILILGMSIFGSLTGAGEKSLNTTNLRNESVLISQHLNRAMENADEIEIIAPESQGTFSSFKVIDRRKTLNTDNTLVETTIETLIEIKNENLMINGRVINSAGFSLVNTTFKLNNSILSGNISVTDKKNGKTLTINEVYRIRGGGETDEVENQ